MTKGIPLNEVALNVDMEGNAETFGDVEKPCITSLS